MRFWYLSHFRAMMAQVAVTVSVCPGLQAVKKQSMDFHISMLISLKLVIKNHLQFASDL